MRRPLRHPPVLAAAFVLLIAGAYMLLVPRADWVGLLPSTRRQPSHFSPSSPSSLPAPSYYRPPPAVERTLASLRKAFEVEYALRSPTSPPQPVYAAPWLSDEQAERYASLAARDTTTSRTMITTITRDISSQLPDLLNTIAVLVHYLGPERLTFSILEGPSSDATPHILNRVLRPLLRDLGVPDNAVRIETDAPKIKWSEVNRIEALADLRNQALKPMLDRSFGDVGPIVFLNDVFLHASDVLELLYQHSLSKASITTAWDWMERDPAYFYDVWVARTVSRPPSALRQIDTGDLFYPIPGTEWHPSEDILSTSPSSKAAFDALRPFQAFSSWNALAVLDPAPFLPPHKVRFRRGGMGECAASECLLICSDFWKTGHGRVQVVPSVQLAYGRDVALQTAQRLREYSVQLGWKGGVPPKDTPLEWRKDPPPKVRCNPWPKIMGLSANVWEKTSWLAPWA